MYNNFPIDNIRLIFSATLNPGVVLLGGAGSTGKTSTINFLMDYIKKTPPLNPQPTVFIDTATEREKGRSISAYVGEIMLNNIGNQMLVSIDEVNDADSLNAVLMLAAMGHTVIAITGIQEPQGLAGVLSFVLETVEAKDREFVARKLITNLSMLVQQITYCSQEYGKPEYRLSRCSMGSKKMLIGLLDQYGLHYLYKKGITNLLE
ncbi:MAG: hypothetical protein J6N72_09070 [Psychrobacter sp.]|nr:hypothetical protein [Psychrobacter sp.]